MTQPSRVLYLPPGVMPPAQPVVVGAGPAVSTGVPFDRAFFEQLLPQAIASFCQQVECKEPLVELLTIDGVTHYVVGISGVSDSWVALHTANPDHDHPIQVFIPYQTIFRVEVHPAEDERRNRLGFVRTPVPVVPAGTALAPAAASRKKSAKR